MNKNYSDAGKKRWSDPKYREQMVGLHRTEEYLKFASERQKTLWQDPDFKKGVAETMKKVRASPEYIENVRLAKEKLMSDPAHVEKLRVNFARVNASRSSEERSTVAKKAWTQERKDSFAEKMKSQWADPTFKESRKKALKVYSASEIGRKGRAMRTVRSWCKAATDIVLSEAGISLTGLSALLTKAASENFHKSELKNSKAEERAKFLREVSLFDDYGLGKLSTAFPTVDTVGLLEACLTLAYRSEASGKETARDQEKNVRTGLTDSHATQRSKMECRLQDEIEKASGLQAVHLPSVGDIVFESEKVCVEVDGDVFHAVARHHNSATQPVSPLYHMNRTRYIRSKGYRVIRFWGHEVDGRKEQCLNFALGALGCGRRVGARETVAKVVDKETAASLVNSWHIQALPAHGFLFAAVLEESKTGSPVAVITFGKHHRQNAGENIVCLTRLAFEKGVNVIGGSEKLLAFAKQTFLQKGQTLVSWSHERLGEGKVYARLGFTKTATLRPDYHYVCRAGEVLDKQSCQRKVLRRRLDIIGISWNKEDTEEKLAAHLSMSRCYDAGKIRWEISL